MPRYFRWATIAALLAAQCIASRVDAQWQSNTGAAGAALGATVGGDVERYMRR